MVTCAASFPGRLSYDPTMARAAARDHVSSDAQAEMVARAAAGVLVIEAAPSNA
jgi:hypothetical protein